MDRLKLRDVSVTIKNGGVEIAAQGFYGQLKPHLLQLEEFLRCFVLS